MTGRPTEPVASDAPPALTALALALRDVRGQRSVRDVARLCETSAGTASRILSGRSLPSWQMVQMIIEACGGDEEYLRSLWAEANAEKYRAKTGRVHLMNRLAVAEKQLAEHQRRIEELEAMVRSLRSSSSSECST